MLGFSFRMVPWDETRRNSKQSSHGILFRSLFLAHNTCFRIKTAGVRHYILVLMFNILVHCIAAMTVSIFLAIVYSLLIQTLLLLFPFLWQFNSYLSASSVPFDRAHLTLTPCHPPTWPPVGQVVLMVHSYSPKFRLHPSVPVDVPVACEA